MAHLDNCKSRQNIGSALMAVLASLFVLGFAGTPAVQAQTFTVLHSFTGGNDGAAPFAGVSIDRAGNLYGSAAYGGFTGNGCGAMGCGTVFKLTQANGGWLVNLLYVFQGGTDGFYPEAQIVIAPDGTVDGTTSQGGTGSGGTVFNLRPPVATCRNTACRWTKSALYQFSGNGDGAGPVGTLVFDAAGNVYGVTQGGGAQAYGVVYELTRSGGS